MQPAGALAWLHRCNIARARVSARQDTAVRPSAVTRCLADPARRAARRRFPL
ncbi:hypothetical protein I35_5411 [Burkholderia cenocepacia H111]|nr:hypothetical protein I35_5411 [Burkholderia cenocepacia H111]